jgi:hypothetical protein
LHEIVNEMAETEAAKEIVCGNCGHRYSLPVSAAKKEKLCRNCIQPFSTGKYSKPLVKAGEAPLLKRVAREFAPTRARLKLVEDALKISEQPDDAERAYMARQLVQCTLPHSDPGNVPVWSRRSGSVTLVIQQGYDDDETPIGYPYGAIPRLLLFWIVTEANFQKNRPGLSMQQRRRLELGRSLAQFMRAVGLNPDNGSGKRSDAGRLKKQMVRLLDAKITFQGTIETEQAIGKRRKAMDVTSDSELWWSVKKPEQGALWPSWIDVGENFYEAITTNPVPFDLRALRMLKRSPLALDVYAWACYRAFPIVQKKQPPQFVSWTMLMRQLGTGITDVGNFRDKMKPTLRKIVLAYPGLTIKQVPGGFTIHASRLAIAAKEPVQISADGASFQR